MTSEQAIKFFGTQTALASALGISQGTVSRWGEHPPAIQQLRIQHITLGKLMAERDALEPLHGSGIGESKYRHRAPQDKVIVRTACKELQP